MTYTRQEALDLLNGEHALENLRRLVAAEPAPAAGRDVNNHIHTTYSFSPYSPAAAVWFARQAGLCTCGLMDHDTIAGADEFLAAAEIAGMAATIGMECRASFANTPFSDKKLNNPDQAGVMYIALHGVPHDRAGELTRAMAPYREKRNARNRRMVDAINGMMARYGVTVDFDRDVLPLSNYARGGSVTERHLSRALAERMIEVAGSSAKLVRFIHEELKLPVPAKIEARLLDEDNPYRDYDLLGWIKSELIARFYIDADDELMDVRDALALSERIGAISAMAYLGDVGDSVTGDKRAQNFEDDYLDELIEYVAAIGFRAVTYMPSRNTRAQLVRLRALCDKHGLFQISGEDINSPRQSFVCEAQRDPAFSNLYDATWALIAHEWRSTDDPAGGFFSPQSIERWPSLDERVRAFRDFGLARFGRA